ncbi:hypothetical protein AJ80_03668 [Polytolypa hystricis UAMH7299]|uniref:Serine aminopeptidase S33 domain-containing protein n=1 Tax=Polytolypa hystricis (strain UAMH7299) TaxID=1447883 RepID=A0A2B7YFY5_POLH7|nr:hypothetical protein AJ80_03668 [Polytolypa hystricis UAMH7299]
MPFKTINSKSLYYTLTPGSSTASPSSSPITILFIHGLGSSSSFYYPIIPHLSQLGFRCLALDTHGSGASAYSGTGNSIASIAADALGLLDALDIKQDVVVVGHSMGGIIASYLAASDESNRFKGVVLVGPVNPNPGAAEIFSKRIQTVEADGMEPMATTIPIAATGSKSTPLVHAFIRQLIISTDPQAYISLCRAIAEAPVPDYSQIEIPMLLLAGDEDKSAPMEGCKMILEEYATPSTKKKIVTLGGVGHWHILEAPEETGRVIGEFLGEL